MSQLSGETIHASAVAIGDRAVLIEGGSGTGKSDLALRLIDRGAVLIADDAVLVQRHAGILLAFPPDRIAGRIEVHGIGIVQMDFRTGVPVAMVVQTHDQPVRMPEPGNTRLLLGQKVPAILVDPMAASAPIKVELALRAVPA